jgi:hypothetical protein
MVNSSLITAAKWEAFAGCGPETADFARARDSENSTTH